MNILLFYCGHLKHFNSIAISVNNSSFLFFQQSKYDNKALSPSLPLLSSKMIKPASHLTRKCFYANPDTSVWILYRFRSSFYKNTPAESEKKLAKWLDIEVVCLSDMVMVKFSVFFLVDVSQGGWVSLDKNVFLVAIWVWMWSFNYN